jgi:hypothetical protein
MSAIFISYSHRDKKWLEDLLRFLGGGLFQEHTVWSDEQIAVGDQWYREIERALKDARVAILLVSQNFVTSKFIMEEEVMALLDRRRRSKELRIFPLLVEESTWKAIDKLRWLQDTEARPKDGPLHGRARAERQKLLVAFAIEVKNIVEPPPEQQETEEYRGKGEARAQGSVRSPGLDLGRRARQAVAASPGQGHVLSSKTAPLKQGLSNPGAGTQGGLLNAGSGFATGISGARK